MVLEETDLRKSPPGKVEMNAKQTGKTDKNDRHAGSFRDR
jgi:hypothetical protein